MAVTSPAAVDAADAAPVEMAAESEPMAELDPFFERLRALDEQDEGGAGRLVRVLHFGDSHTAADFLTTAIRRAFQQRFGDGGRGFVLLGQPWRSYRPKDVKVESSPGWTAKRVRLSTPPSELDTRLGLPGIAVDTEDVAQVSVSTALATRFGNRVSSVEIYYMKQPGGGSFVVTADGRVVRAVKTTAAQNESGFVRIELEPGMHRVGIRTRGDGRVRLFGAVLEDRGPGVVYDTLGINGAFFKTPLRWNTTLFQQQMARRDPDLLVVMYGANDANSRTLTPERYERVVRETLERFQDSAPEASCLVLGPPDRVPGKHFSEVSPPLDWIIETQKRVAAQKRCAFIDLQALMGGAGGHRIWQQRELAQNDGIHLTVRGYLELGQMVADLLLDEYGRFTAREAKQTARTKTTEEAKPSGGAPLSGGEERGENDDAT